MNALSDDPVEPPRRGRRWLRALLVVACFLVAVAGTASLIDAQLPFPTVPDIAPRFRYVAERKDEFDTIFIGSSRFRHQIIPERFDAETASLGAGTHSFNLGFSGMWPPESYYVLRRLLALHPQHLRWVVIELMDHRFGEAEHLPPTMRMIYWHDWKHTDMAFRWFLEAPFPVWEKMQQLVTHTWLLMERTANPGRGAEWLRDRYFPPKDKSITSWIARRGYDPEEKSEWTEVARAELASKVAALEKSLPPQRVRPGFAAALRDIISDVQRAGAKPIFIIAPTVLAEENLVLDLPPGMTIWAFNQPAEYPQLYQPEAHYNQGHLSEKGAQEWTSMLARRFADEVQSR